MADNKEYPELQYSAFLDKAQREQIVIRADSWDKFVEYKKKIDKIIDKRKADEPEEKTYTCNDCGAEAVLKSGVSKAGKPWKAIFCVDNKEHVKWL